LRFQSTRPRGARRSLSRLHSRRLWFQSTRPRGARPDLAAVLQMSIEVSIHAPAWGATSSTCIRCYNGLSSFNPRARVGRDVVSEHAIDRWCESFNPRARVGRDVPNTASCLRTPSFNPRARVGRDVAPPHNLHAREHVSIHAPAWGATRKPVIFSVTPSGFNPRA